MTIPTRPAPAPPGSGSAAAAGANASLEQLRRQLQQQHLEQQQQHHQQQQHQQTQKLTIKLPPPPKGGRPLQQQSATKKSFNNNYFDDNQTGGGSNITRKFPQARLYTPATNWDDDPFSGGKSNTSNGNGLGLKKMPPPRPPPPKVQVNGHRSNEAAASGGSGNRLIPNIFQRKKATNTSSATAAATKAAAQNRVYGLSSGQVAGNNAGGFTTTSSSSTNYDWNAAWNTATTSSSSSISGSNFVGSSMASSSSTSGAGVAEGQLISFDSPPSSPTFTQKSNSDCVSVDSFSSDSNFSSPNNGSVSQPESGFEDDYHHRSRPSTQSPLDPWEAVDSSGGNYGTIDSFGSAPVRQMQLQGRSSDNPLCNGKSLLPPTQSLQMPTIIKPKISQKPKAPKPPPFIGGMPGSYLGGGGGAGRAGVCTPPSPPMPKGEPPKLPSTSAGMGAASGGICLLDVISGKVDALALSKGTLGYIEEEQIPYAIALYDFDGVEEGDLNFRENEKIYLLEQPTPEWLRGRTRAGCEGIFPANYVEIKVPLSSNSNQLGSPATQSPISVQATARCLYQFPGEVEGDLSLQENDLVTVLYRINDDWLYGEIDGRQGQFPANFLEHIPPNLPTM